MFLTPNHARRLLGAIIISTLSVSLLTVVTACGGSGGDSSTNQQNVNLSQDNSSNNNDNNDNNVGEAAAHLLWTYSNEAVAKTVSIGAQGTEVFSQLEFGNDKALLFSGDSSSSSTPLWENPIPAEALNAYVDSAEAVDTHVALHQMLVNHNNTTRQTIVSKYTAASSTPDWTYAFSEITSGIGRIAISRDGQRIAAVSIIPSQAKLQVAVFASNSNVPRTRDIANFGLVLYGFALAADGSALYVSSGTQWLVLNLNDPALPTIGNATLPIGLDADAISGDGSYIAWGEFNRVHIFKRDATNHYNEVYVRTVSGSVIIDRLTMAADSSVLVIGSHYYDQNLKIRVEVINLRPGSDGNNHFESLMVDESTGSGTFQNIVSAVDASADGSRVAVGLWGDEGDICPELRFYQRGEDGNYAPLAFVNQPGSVYGLRISGDGKHAAAAVKSVHANSYSGGGFIKLYALP